MKLLSSRHHVASAQILAEAAIGLSLMTFAWILIAYSLYLANYKIRTEMAARYAAWYQANNGGTAATRAPSLTTATFSLNRACPEYRECVTRY